MVRFFVLIFFLINFSGCEDYMNISKTIKHINSIAKRKYCLEQFGSGVAAPGKIKNFRLTFISKIKYSPDEARKLIVDLTEDYILLIKSSPDVYQFFENYPVTESNAFFLVNFVDENDNDRLGFSGISLANGNIEFLTLDENSMFKEYHRETYSEAYFKVYGIPPPIRN